MRIHGTGFLFLFAGLSVTPSQASNGAGQGNMWGAGRTNNNSNAQGLYTDLTKEPFGHDHRPMQRDMSEEQNSLPPGWSEHFDQSSGQYYYYNYLDGTTTWDKPAPANEETPLENNLKRSVERGETQVSDLTSVLERDGTSPQERQMVEDSPFGRQQSWDSQDSGMSIGQFPGENSVLSRPTKHESQPGDSFSSGVQTTENAAGQRWTQQDIASGPDENRESLQPLNGPRDNTNGALEPQSVPRNPVMILNVPNGSHDSAENQEYDGWRANTHPNSESAQKNPGMMLNAPNGRHDSAESQENDGWRVVGRTPPEQPQVGGWGLPTQGTDELRRGTPQPQPSSPAFVRRDINPDTIPQDSRFESASGLPPELRQISSPGKFRTPGEAPLHHRSNSAHRNPIYRPSQVSGTECEKRQEFAGGNIPSNVHSATQHRPSSPWNGDPRFNAHPSNAAHGSVSEGPRLEVPRPTLPRPQYPSSQYAEYRNRAIAPQGQYQHWQYQQPQGNPKPSQYTDYNTQQQAYNHQSSVSDAVTSVLEDGTTAVKDVIGKSWQGLVGFSSRTMEAMGQARDQVVTEASVAGQSISEKSTNWWGQAKSAFGRVFEKGDDTTQPQNSMSNQHGGQSPQRYPPRQNTQSYQGHSPAAYGPQGGRVQTPNSRQHERQPFSDQRNLQGKHYEAQNGQSRGPRPQPRHDPPLPHQGQARTPLQPFQNQYRDPPRRPSYTDQQAHQADRRPQLSSQDRHPDPWSHPGLSGDE